MGGFTEPVTEPPVVVAGQPSFLASIDWGTKLASNDIKIYFAGAGQVFDGKTSVGWNDYEQQQTLLALAQFSNVADLHFAVTTDASQADLTLVNKEKAGYLGYFNPPGTNDAGVGVFNHTGRGWDAEAPGTGGLEQGGYGFITLLHELGHAMGLAHPHDRGGTSTVWEGVRQPEGSFGTFDLNQGIFTTMTYNDGWQTDPFGKNRALDHGWQGTMMGFDIAVLQQKYGANSSFAAGDDSYDLPGTNRSGTFFASIWDTGGTDTIRFGGARDSTIDLRAAHLAYAAGSGGYVSHAHGAHGGFTIAHGVVIENATGGSGDDVIIGNGAANVLQGGAGADRMTGGGGADSFVFAALADSGNLPTTRDRIADFADVDLIDLSAIDATPHQGANDAFVWINTTRFHGTEGELRWKANAAGVLVLADHDGDGAADFKLMLHGLTSLTEDAFTL